MTRSSRHKSHKQKQSSRDLREHSDSEEEDLLLERKRKGDSGVRASDSTGKRELPSQSQQEKDLPLDYSASKSRKERAYSAAADRWGGCEGRQVQGSVPEKDPRGEGFGSDSLEKRQKPHVPEAEESKSRSSRRQESSSESRKDEENEDAKRGSGRVDLKRKSDKDAGRRDANDHKDAMEKGRNTDRKVQDVRRERSVDNGTRMPGGGSEMSRKQGTRTGSSAEERHAKRVIEKTDGQMRDKVHNPELEKEFVKQNKRHDGSGDTDRDGEERRLSSRDDHLKNGRCKGERHKDDKYRDRYRDDLDRDHRYRDDKHKDERSRDSTMDRSDKSSESCHKKAKLQSSDHDGSPYVDDRGNRNEDDRGRKRSSYDFEDRGDLNTRSNKQHLTDGVKSALSGNKLDSVADIGRSESLDHHSDVADHCTLSYSLLKSSPSSGSHAVKDHYRHESKHAESQETFSEGMHRPDTAATREVVGGFGSSNSVLESLPIDGQIQMSHSHLTEISAETPACTQYGRSPKSAHQLPPIQLAEKPPSSGGDRRYSNRTVVRNRLEVDEMARNNGGFKDAQDHSSNRDRGWELPSEHLVDDLSLMQLDGEAAPVGSTSRLSRRSPLPPPLPPFKHGFDSPPLLGSSEEDSRVAADRKPTNRFKKSVDPSMGRGQGNAFKGVPNWPSPVANGFLPFPHGPPPGGFHALMQQFPATPLFGVRPSSSMELSHPVVSYPMHDADRFSGHVRPPFGWRTSTDDSCPPHLHGWDGSNSVFGDKSRIYRRPEWDQNRHLMSGRGWEMNAGMWKGHNGNVMEDLSASKSELDYSAHVPSDEHLPGHSSHHRSLDFMDQSERSLAGRNEAKLSDCTPEKIPAEAPLKIVHEETPKEYKRSSSDSSGLCSMYLSTVDISVDLSSPELYKQCMSLMEMDGGTKNVTRQIYPEEEIKVVESRCSDHILRDSLFPAITEAVHQRAMDLYNKQKVQMKAKTRASSSDGSKLDEAFLVSGEGAEPIEDQSSHEPIEDQSSHAMRGSPINEKDGEGTSNNSQGDLFVDANKECQSNTVSGHVFSADDSRAFEALMPESVECMVKLSQIQNPVESTH